MAGIEDLNRTGFQDGTTMDLKYINPGFDKSEGIVSGMGGFPIVPAAGIGAVLALNKKRGIGDNNPPSPIDEEPKPPEQKPPESPDIISDIALGKLIEDNIDDMKFKLELTEEQEAGVTAYMAQDIRSKDFTKWKRDKKLRGHYRNEDYPNVILDRVKASGVLRPWSIDVGYWKKDTFVPIKSFAGLYNKQDSIFLSHNLQNQFNRQTSKLVKGKRAFEEKAKLEEKEEFEKLRPSLQKYLLEKEKTKKAMGGLIDRPLIGGSRYI